MRLRAVGRPKHSIAVFSACGCSCYTSPWTII